MFGKVLLKTNRIRIAVGGLENRIEHCLPANAKPVLVEAISPVQKLKSLDLSFLSIPRKNLVLYQEDMEIVLK